MALTAAEKTEIRNELVAMLRSVERFDKRDVHNKHPGARIEVEHLLWEARELVRREDGVDFGPVRGFPGLYARKDWRQIGRRGERQRARGTRAHQRAAERLRLAAEQAPPEEAEAARRLNDAADRVAMRIAMRGSKTG